MSNPIRSERRGTVLEVTIDRPKANAIDAPTSRIMCPQAVAILRHLEKPWDRRCRYLRDTRAAAVRLTAIRLWQA